MLIVAIIAGIIIIAVAAAAGAAAAEAVDEDPNRSEDDGSQTPGSILLGVITGVIVGAIIGAVAGGVIGAVIGGLIGGIAGGVGAAQKDIIQGVGIGPTLDGIFRQDPTDPSPQWRPGYHFSPEKGWMNDPCGLIYYDGLYHLFFQHVPTDQTAEYFPFSRNTGGVVWGHAVGKDLLSWDQHPLPEDPLYVSKGLLNWDEHPLQQDPDLGAPFTGSAVTAPADSEAFAAEGSLAADAGGQALVLKFTHNQLVLGVLPKQRQSLALLSAEGKFISFSGNPVLYRSSWVDWNFRDPKVVRFEPQAQETKPFWVMPLAGGEDVLFRQSRDLVLWDPLPGGGPASKHSIYSGGSFFVECPELVRVPVLNNGEEQEEARWVLLFSRGAIPGTSSTGTQYLVGSFDENGFARSLDQPVPEWLDFGPDLYATQSWFGLGATRSRPVIAGWLNNWQYAEYAPTNPWRGQLSIPRELFLLAREDRLVLAQLPIPELEGLRQGPVSMREVNIPPNDSIKVPAADGTPLHLKVGELILAIDTSDADVVGVRLHVGDEEQTVVKWERLTGNGGQIVLDRSQSGRVEFHEAFSRPYTAPYMLNDGLLRLRILLDRSSVEIFAGEGEIVLSALVFAKASSDGLELFAAGGTEALVAAIEAFDLPELFGGDA